MIEVTVPLGDDGLPHPSGPVVAHGPGRYRAPGSGWSAPTTAHRPLRKRSESGTTRAMVITANAPSLFARLLAGAITLTFFTYAFVNMGMVSGILPVVGVPLPLISYGGTSLVSICIGFGILMSINTHKKLVQT